MRLALQTDYALRTLMYLAFREQRVRVQEIADFYGISQAHVAKVVNQLARHSYVRSIRGLGGGLELARRPEEIRIGAVIRTFEGSTQLLECVSAEQPVCVVQDFCKLRGVLGEAERLQMEYLDSVRLSDVVPTRREVSRIASSET